MLDTIIEYDELQWNIPSIMIGDGYFPNEYPECIKGVHVLLKYKNGVYLSVIMIYIIRS